MFAAPQVDDFEGGVDSGGWSFISPSADVQETSGGNPGGWNHSPVVDSFAPIARSTAMGAGFDGDYRALGVTGLSVDAQTLLTNFAVNGFEFSLLLRDTKGTASVTDDNYAYFVGTEIPLPGAGWKSFFFSIPSASTASTPAGWSGVRVDKADATSQKRAKSQ